MAIEYLGIAVAVIVPFMIGLIVGRSPVLGFLFGSSMLGYIAVESQWSELLGIYTILMMFFSLGIASALYSVFRGGGQEIGGETT